MNSVPTSMIVIPSLLFVSFYFISIVRYHDLLSRSNEPLLAHLHVHITKRSNAHHGKAVTKIETDNWKNSNPQNRRDPPSIVGEEGNSITNSKGQLELQLHEEPTTSPASTWPHPFIHIVTTRFMQEQAHLIHLTRARFELFEAICFPSMVNQEFKYLGTDEDIQKKIIEDAKAASSSIDPSIIWIIKTDPQLEEMTKKKLIQILKPYPNFYLIGTNANARTWRDETELQAMIQSEIYTGDRAMLMRVYNERSKKMIIESRLDADDGLHRIYLQSMQQYALRTLTPYIKISSRKGRKQRHAWAAWCPLKSLEWFHENQGSTLLNDLGGIRPVFNSQHCITAGLTIASTPHVDPRDLQLQHQMLFHHVRLKGCGLPNKSDCVKLISKPVISAIRARTTTSAGMKDVGGSSSQTDLALHSRVKNEVNMLKEDERRSTMLLSDFGIEDEMLDLVKSYFAENALRIAEDNLKGQCTSGHSCKESSKAKLQKIIQDLKDST